MVINHRITRPYRILVEPSDFILLNAGDTAMMQVALSRLVEIWPGATIQVLTEDANLLDYCPGQIIPLLATGRHAWVHSRKLNPRSYGRVADRAEVRGRAFLRTLKQSSRSILRKFTNSKSESFAGAGSQALDSYLAAVRQADLVIATGMGGITDAFPDYAFGLLQTLEFAVESGTMAAMVGQGIGPLEKPDLFAVAKRVLPKIDFISLREGLHGLSLLKRLGVSLDRVSVSGDDAIELGYRHRTPAIGNYLGINVRRASYSAFGPREMEGLRAPIASIIEMLKCSAIPVPVSRRSEESDLKSFADLLDAGADVCARAENIKTPLHLVEQISRCRLVIVGSYHAAVFALAQGVSAIGLAASAYYIQKFEGLADQFGAGCEVVRICEEGFQEKLKATAIRMWNSAEDARPHLISRASEQVAASKEAYKALARKANARFAVTGNQA